MIRSILTLMLALTLSIGLCEVAVAQSQDLRQSQSVSISTTNDGRIKLKVTQRKGDDETIFEKTYDSHEEMQNDEELEKYGIDKRSLGFGSRGANPQFFFHNGPAQSFWDDDAFDMSPFREMEERMREMMKNFGGSSFSFSLDDDAFMDMDSLMQRFDFRNDNGTYYFNGEKITDMDSLRDAMKDRFQNFYFDFDDKRGKNGFNSWSDYEQESDDDVKVISRAQVRVLSAQEKDKVLVNTNEMGSLELRDISFYPNPSDGRFDLELQTKSNDPLQVIIVDEEGDEVYNKLATPEDLRYNFRIDLTNEGKGIYVLKLIQNNKALTKRIVIE